jgi:hypothetical protein
MESDNAAPKTREPKKKKVFSKGTPGILRWDGNGNIPFPMFGLQNQMVPNRSYVPISCFRTTCVVASKVAHTSMLRTSVILNLASLLNSINGFLTKTKSNSCLQLTLVMVSDLCDYPLVENHSMDCFL